MVPGSSSTPRRGTAGRYLREDGRMGKVKRSLGSSRKADVTVSYHRWS